MSDTQWELSIKSPTTGEFEHSVFTSEAKLKRSWAWKLRGSKHWIIFRNGYEHATNIKGVVV